MREGLGEQRKTKGETVLVQLLLEEGEGAADTEGGVRMGQVE